MKLSYDKLYEQFLSFINPEMDVINKRIEECGVDSDDGPHIYFSYVISYYICYCLLNKEVDKLKKIGNFIEIMLESDTLICEVAEFSIIETLLSNCEQIELLLPYFKEKTLKSYYRLNTFYGKKAV